MSYTKNWVASPNYTPAAQTQAAYGRPRSIQGGAGHWWNYPRSGARHDGIVSYMANASRQAAPHAVLSAGRVTEMVRDRDTAWCTGNANPYTFAIEIDPRIMFKWGQYSPSAAEKKLGNEIFETLCEYIADKGYHNLPWKPHKVWAPGTECNPIPYGDVMKRAKEIYAAKHAPKPTFKWVAMDDPRDMIALKDIKVYDLKNKKSIGSTIKKGTKVSFKTKTTYNGAEYLRSVYSTTNKLDQGLLRSAFGEVPAPVPEWQKNLKDIKPVKLTVLVNQTPIIDLNTLNVIKQLGKGTVVDFTKSTTVKGVEYLISSWSASQAIPNGIKKADVGVPAEPPVSEKPEWLKNWKDITDVVMYARADTDLVNFEDGSTIKVIPRGTEIEIGSTTELHGFKYAITKYSTEKKFWQGIRLDDLDMKPVNDDPLEPAPEQPNIEDRLNWLEKAVKAILEFLKIKV